MLWAVVAQVATLTKQRLPPNHAVAAAVASSIFLVPADNKHEERPTKYSPNSTGAPHLVREILEVLLRNGREYSLLVGYGLEKFLNEFA